MVWVYYLYHAFEGIVKGNFPFLTTKCSAIKEVAKWLLGKRLRFTSFFKVFVLCGNKKHVIWLPVKLLLLPVIL